MVIRNSIKLTVRSNHHAHALSVILINSLVRKLDLELSFWSVIDVLSGVNTCLFMCPGKSHATPVWFRPRLERPGRRKGLLGPNCKELWKRFSYTLLRPEVGSEIGLTMLIYLP